MGKTIERTIDVERGYEVFRTWRVVETDNGGGDYPDEKFVAIDIAGPVLAEGFAKMWNDSSQRERPKRTNLQGRRAHRDSVQARAGVRTVKLTSDWSNRLRESPSDGPMIHAVPQRVRFHSEFSGPVRKNHSSACVSNPAIGTFVSSLLLRCCPFAIGFPAVVFAFCALSTRVVKIVLLPLNGVTSRSSAHVSKESLIRSSPRETDRDSLWLRIFVTGAISNRSIFASSTSRRCTRPSVRRVFCSRRQSQPSSYSRTIW